MQLGTGQMCLSSPTVALGHVFVGTDMNGLLCVGQPSTARQIASWPSALGGPGKSGWSDRSPVPERYRFAWRYPRSDSSEGEKPIPVPVGSVACVGGDILLSQAGETPGVARLTPGRKSCKQKWFHPTTATLPGPPAIVGKTAFVVDGRPGDSDRSLRLLNLESGALSGQRPVAANASGAMLVTARHLLIHDGDARLSCYDVTVGEDEVALPGEKPAWQATVESPVGTPVLGHSMVFLACSSPASVKALSMVNGQELWSKPLAARPVTGVILRGQQLAVGTEQGISVVSVLDGAIEWEKACGKVAGALVADSALLGCTLTNAIAVFNWQGEKLMQAEETTPGISPMLCADKVVYLKPDGVEAYDFSSGETQRIAGGLSWLGPAVTPGVILKSHLYFSTERRGLVCLRPR